MTKEDKKVYMAAYHQRPEIKERARVYSLRPDVIEHRKLRAQAYGQRLEVIARRRAQKKTWYQRPAVKESVRNHRRELNYGLTKEAFDALLLSQDGVCAICGGTNWGHRGPNVDHDHDGQGVRGILCLNCNMAIGHLGDDSRRAEAAMHYLDKYDARRKKCQT